MTAMAVECRELLEWEMFIPYAMTQFTDIVLLPVYVLLVLEVGAYFHLLPMKALVWHVFVEEVCSLAVASMALVLVPMLFGYLVGWLMRHRFD